MVSYAYLSLKTPSRSGFLLGMAFLPMPLYLYIICPECIDQSCVRFQFARSCFFYPQTRFFVYKEPVLGVHVPAGALCTAPQTHFVLFQMSTCHGGPVRARFCIPNIWHLAPCILFNQYCSHSYYTLRQDSPFTRWHMKIDRAN